MSVLQRERSAIIEIYDPRHAQEAHVTQAEIRALGFDLPTTAAGATRSSATRWTRAIARARQARRDVRRRSPPGGRMTIRRGQGAAGCDRSRRSSTTANGSGRFGRDHGEPTLRAFTRDGARPWATRTRRRCPRCARCSRTRSRTSWPMRTRSRGSASSGTRTRGHHRAHARGGARARRGLRARMHGGASGGGRRADSGRPTRACVRARSSLRATACSTATSTTCAARSIAGSVARPNPSTTAPASSTCPSRRSAPCWRSRGDSRRSDLSLQARQPVAPGELAPHVGPGPRRVRRGLPATHHLRQRLRR